MNIIETDVFPHVGDDFNKKAYYLGHTVHKILNVHFKIEHPTVEIRLFISVLTFRIFACIVQRKL